MKKVFQFSLLLILLGGFAVESAWPQEKKGSAAQREELRRNTQGAASPQEEKKDHSSQMEMNGMGDGMMDDPMMSMMSRQHDMMGTMLNTMKEMAQILKEETKGSDTKARADQLLATIKKMEDQHKMMMGMMNMMMSEHGAGPPMK